MKYKNRRAFNTSFEADLIDDFTKQCEREGKSRNQVLTQLIEGYLRNITPINEQPKMDLFIHNQEVLVMPRLDAPNLDWTTYWKTCDLKESGRLEGVFSKRAKEAKIRFYEIRREIIITKMVNNNK